MPHTPKIPSGRQVAERIAAERVRLGLTQAEVADRLDISRETYKQLERHANPQAGTLYALVFRVGMNPAAILPELFA